MSGEEKKKPLTKPGISGEIDPASESGEFRFSRWGKGGSDVHRLPEPPPFSAQQLDSTAGTKTFQSPVSEPALLAPQPAVKPDFSILLDELLAPAPRKEINGKSVVMLGGILLISKLGQGGMGAVYYGIHPRLDQEVAVKVLPKSVSKNDPSAAQRFIREARLAFSVRSQHLVGVIDVNEEKGLLYLVMEYVAGKTAGVYQRDAHARTGKHLPEQIVLDICMGAAKGLEAAHLRGVIHRDIKPDNLMIPYTHCAAEQRNSRTPLNFEQTKLMDLGLARKEMRDKSMQRKGFMLGTLGFMAPEQMLDASAVGKPADVFGVGATMFSMLTGRMPLTRQSTLSKGTGKRSRPKFQAIRSVCPEISLPTANLVDRCLAIQPEMRPADGTTLLREIRAVRAQINPSYNGHYSGEWPAVV